MNVPYTRIDAVYYTLYSYAAYIYIYILPFFIPSLSSILTSRENDFAGKTNEQQGENAFIR